MTCKGPPYSSRPEKIFMAGNPSQKTNMIQMKRLMRCMQEAMPGMSDSEKMPKCPMFQEGSEGHSLKCLPEAWLEAWAGYGLDLDQYSSEVAVVGQWGHKAVVTVAGGATYTTYWV
ncbi:hypothetical protein Tco_0044832 [Tanacetum coccineum]